MKMSKPTAASPAVTRLYGVAFLLLLTALLALSVAFYQHAFTSGVHIQLRVDSVGDQLAPAADVKLRGLIVGQVDAIHSDGTLATVDITLHPDDAALIPANADARLLPKTLFGATEVDLQLPAGPAARPVREGDVIDQDHSKAGIEVQKVLGDLLPLLRTIEPGKLNATLAAFADALEGRGDQLGANLTRVDDYISRLNPQLPAIQADLRALADATAVYGAAAPDILTTLRNLVVTSQTVVAKQDQLTALLTGAQSFATTAQGVLGDDGQRIITLSHVGAPTLALLARYSPEFPCLLGGIADFEPRIQQAFSGGRLHITLEVVVPRAPYKPGEQPRYADRSGPDCRGLPDPPVPAPGVKLNDGTSGAASANSASVAGTTDEQHLVDALVAPVMGLPADQVPAVATLLFGPLARGTAVSVS